MAMMLALVNEVKPEVLCVASGSEFYELGCGTLCLFPFARRLGIL